MPHTKTFALIFFLAATFACPDYALATPIPRDKTNALPEDILAQFISKYTGQDWLHCMSLATPEFELRLVQRLNALTPEQIKSLFEKLAKGKYKILSKKATETGAVIEVSFSNEIIAKISFVQFNRRWKLSSADEHPSGREDADKDGIIAPAFVTPFARRVMLIRLNGKIFFFEALTFEQRYKFYQAASREERDTIIKTYWPGGNLTDIFAEDSVIKINEQIFSKIFPSGDATQLKIPECAEKLLATQLPENSEETDLLAKLHNIQKNVEKDSRQLGRFNWLISRFSRKDLPLWEFTWFAENIPLDKKMDDRLFRELSVFQHLAGLYSRPPHKPLFGEREAGDDKIAREKILSYLKKESEGLKEGIDAYAETFFRVWDKVRLRNVFEKGKKSIFEEHHKKNIDKLFYQG